MSLIEDAEIHKLTVADWQGLLAGLSDEQIKAGLDKLPNDWPPTAGEFRALCVGSQGPWQLRTAAYLPMDRSHLLEVKPDKGKAQAALVKAREFLSSSLSARERQRRLDDANRLLFGGEYDG